MIGSLGQQLHGEVNLAYEPSGLIYTMNVPLKALTRRFRLGSSLASRPRVKHLQCPNVLSRCN